MLELRHRDRSKFSPCAEEDIRIRFIINPFSDKDVLLQCQVVRVSLNWESGTALHYYVLWQVAREFLWV